MGKTKEEIYASFRQTVLDIERLLLMRDCPPSPPAPLDWGSTRPATDIGTAAESLNIRKDHSQTLSAEDLGMLLLHVHELRQILWESRRRFRFDELQKYGRRFLLVSCCFANSTLCPNLLAYDMTLSL